MEGLVFVAIVVWDIAGRIKHSSSSPITVAKARRERYHIEKDIMLLENFILDRELEIKHFDQAFSAAVKSGDKETEEAIKPKLIKALEECKKAYDEKDKKQIEIIRAEYKVKREEAFETM